MGWKGDLVDIPLGLAARAFMPRAPVLSDSPSIFILRNNDIGDLLVTTPLFEALRLRFPRSEIVLGTGSWNMETVRGNPYLSEVVQVNAPWNNKYVAGQGWGDVARYLASSPELAALRQRHFDVGIDVVGSHVGSTLLMRLGIPYRLGVRGYRGGHTAVAQAVQYDEREHVGRSALRFAELLGATKLPEVRPQIFLTAEELEQGERRWTPRANGQAQRIVLGVGAGFPEKCWPEDRFAAAIALLLEDPATEIALLGGTGDRDIGARLAAGNARVRDLTGRLALRETFAAVAASDATLCNPSMLMHVAGAYRVPTIVVLGPYFRSARGHDLQWGYPGTCVSLGLEADHPALASPREAVDALRSLMP